MENSCFVVGIAPRTAACHRGSVCVAPNPTKRHNTAAKGLPLLPGGNLIAVGWAKANAGFHNKME
jgi:hypothetical protein